MGHRLKYRGSLSPAFLPLFLSPILAIALILIPKEALTLPFFARQVGRDCTFCHTVFPKLKERGMLFRANGYRFEGDGGPEGRKGGEGEEAWKEVKDLSQIPLSMEIEIEGKYDKLKESGIKTESSDILIEELEFLSAGAVGKTGRLSYFGSFAIAQEEVNGSTDYDASIMKAFIQINDLAGPVGAGYLNLRAGQAELALPFIGGNQRFIDRAYFAEALNILDPTARLIELNGVISGGGGGGVGDGEDEGEEAGEEDRPFIHFYRAGVSREDVLNDDKLKGFFASYAVNIEEVFSLGLIYRNGRERTGGEDLSYNKLGLSGEARLGPVAVSAGLFSSKLEDRNRLDNILLEALYQPVKRFSLGARLDTLKEKGKERAKAAVFMVRYNILSNAYALLELQRLRDEGHITGSNEEETKLRLFLTALF